MLAFFENADRNALRNSFALSSTSSVLEVEMKVKALK